VPHPVWYLFIHQLPPKPLYLRAKVRRLLARSGALPLKDSVYLLPAGEERLPELRRIAHEAISGGGEAYVCRGSFVERPGPRELVAAFRRARNDDYRSLVAQLREWTARLDRRSGPSPPEGPLRLRLAQARKTLERIRRVDFFEASLRREAEASVVHLEARLREPAASARGRRRSLAPELAGRPWVTRRGIQVDRIASAWLIRRFIDPDARFRFIDPSLEEPRPAELRFDMADGEFTHEDDRCTFETLVRRAGLKAHALDRVAEIIHDIDIKDGKFGRPEARGVEQLLLGMLAANPEDEQRLDRGFALLDDLYRSFARPPRTSSGPRQRSGKPGTQQGGSA